MADGKKNLKPEELPQDELQDEQLSKVNGGGSTFWEEIVRLFSGGSG